MLLSILVDTYAPLHVSEWVGLCKEMIIATSKTTEPRKTKQQSEEDPSIEDDSSMLQSIPVREADDSEIESFLPRLIACCGH